MDSSKLYAGQCKKISAALQPTTAYLLKLQQRMKATGFPENDPLAQKVAVALEAMRELAMDLHHREYPKETKDLGSKTH